MHPKLFLVSSNQEVAPAACSGMPSALGSDVLLRSMDVARIAMGIVATGDTAFLALNNSMSNLLGLPAAEIIGRKLTDFRPGPTGHIRSVVASSGGHPAQFRNIEVLTSSGTQLHVDATLGRYGVFNGTECMLVILADASVRVAAETHARRLIDAADKVSDLISIHDMRLGTVLYCNEAFSAATGVVAGDHGNPVEGMNASQLDIFDAEVIPAIQSEGAWTGVLQTQLGGTTHWLAGTLVGEADGPGRPYKRYITSVLTDVTDEYLRAEVLEFEATHDRLTGLFNRSGVVEWLAAQRPGADCGMAICHLDLDRFQEINDVLGHEIGDQVICEIGRRLAAATRVDDLVGRINGDEFVVAFADVEGPRHAELLAERLKSEIFDKPVVVDGHPIMASASFGLSVSGAGFSGESLLRAADVALYRAKNLGRSHIEIYTADLQVEASRRSHLIEELREAIRTEQLDVWYQPIVSLATGRLTSVEALVRWPLADGTFVPPDDFIPIAESVGLVKDIDRFVLHRALTEIGELVSHGHELELHTNLSATRLTDEALPDEVAKALAEHNFAAHRLCLELTETALALDPVKAEKIVSDLADLGLRLGVDDFGTGYSSLALLHRFRLHVLKVDRSFVQLLDAGSSEAGPIVATILQLAESLGLEVVAEGIETERQKDYFANSTCAYGQGYLFHRPMPFDALRSLVASEFASGEPATAQLSVAAQSSRRSLPG